MKKTIVLVLFAALAISASAATVSDDFENPTAPYDPLGNGWSTDKSWSTWGVQAGAGEGGTQGNIWGGSNWYTISMTNGIAAPVNVSDSVSVSARFQLTTGSTGGQTNKDVYNLGIMAGTGSISNTFVIRDNGLFFSGRVGGEDGWAYYGWNANSQINLQNAGSAASDWFGQKVTVTKAASGYDVLYEILDNGDNVIADRLSNLALTGLAAESTWYAKVSTQDVAAGTDITGIAMDNVVLTNVPEPATMTLLGLGALLLRRKK